MKGADVLFSSDSPEWLTPMPLLHRIKAFFGGVIDLDPSADADCNVPAERYFDQEKDGLKQKWAAETVYLNPPYGRKIGHWTRKLLFERPNYREAITLLPARVDTKWWDELLEADPVICLIKGRLVFRTPHPGPKPLPPDDFSSDEEVWYQEADDAYAKALKNHTDPDAAPFPSALIYVGARRHAFADRFGELGRIYTLF